MMQIDGHKIYMNEGNEVQLMHGKDLEGIALTSTLIRIILMHIGNEQLNLLDPLPLHILIQGLEVQVAGTDIQDPNLYTRRRNILG